MTDDPSHAAYLPQLCDPSGFNPAAQLPYGCTTDHIRQAMDEFIEFLGFVNQQLATKGIQRLETLLMPANFSSMVGEFVIASIPKYCPTLAKNLYHNGHPDLIPAKRFPQNRVQYAQEGIEVKASRYQRGWQGHNAEEGWLMVLVFESNRPRDRLSDTGDVSESQPLVRPIPFRFMLVVCAQLEKSDWRFAGRSETSRRTITASVTDSGYQKMMANWIYKAPSENRAG
jgi:hypothetical protein